MDQAMQVALLDAGDCVAHDCPHYTGCYLGDCKADKLFKPEITTDIGDEQVNIICHSFTPPTEGADGEAT